jgi:calcineurin-like phosphoesterase family protein
MSQRKARSRLATLAIGIVAAVTLPATSIPSFPSVAAAAAGDPVLAAAGDIACPPGERTTAKSCAQKATSDLLVAMQPTAIAALGDSQYDIGSLAQFNGSFDPTWGRLKSKIHPAIGNHEIKVDPKAGGYYSYFGAAAGDKTKGYYSYNLGAWHVVVLNGNCKGVGGCQTGSAQEKWLKADLAANPTACTLAYWHQPRFSSGNHGSDPTYGPFWQALDNAGAEIVLNGHDHNYERFAPQKPNGGRDDVRGIREFVVGTGGSHSEPMSSVKPNSQVRNSTFGVLKLTLHGGSYDWNFLPIAGKTFTDSGTGTCH